MAEGGIAQNNQFLLLSQYLQFYSIHVFKESFHIIDIMFSKASAADLLYVGNAIIIYTGKAVIELK